MFEWNGGHLNLHVRTHSFPTRRSSDLHKVAIGNRGTVENIDAVGGKLVTHGRLNEALALISPLITEHDELTSLEALDGFSYALLQLAPDQLTKVIVGWLLSLDQIGRAHV